MSYYELLLMIAALGTYLAITGIMVRDSKHNKTQQLWASHIHYVAQVHVFLV